MELLEPGTKVRLTERGVAITGPYPALDEYTIKRYMPLTDWYEMEESYDSIVFHIPVTYRFTPDEFEVVE